MYQEVKEENKGRSEGSIMKFRTIREIRSNDVIEGCT